MKISEEAIESIKSKHEILNDSVINNFTPKLFEVIEDEISNVSELCDKFNIEISSEEITFIRFIIAHAICVGVPEGRLYELNKIKKESRNGICK